MHGNRKVGSAEPTSEERVKRNEKLASASTAGVVVRAAQTVATSAEGQKEDDPENTASTVRIAIKQTGSTSVAVATEGQKKDNPENAASTSVIVVCSASAGCCC